MYVKHHKNCVKHTIFLAIIDILAISPFAKDLLFYFCSYNHIDAIL
jgi:hypothetical protein